MPSASWRSSTSSTVTGLLAFSLRRQTGTSTGVISEAECACGQRTTWARLLGRIIIHTGLPKKTVPAVSKQMKPISLASRWNTSQVFSASSRVVAGSSAWRVMWGRTAESSPTKRSPTLPAM